MVYVGVRTGPGVQWEQKKPTERKLQTGETWHVHIEISISCHNSCLLKTCLCLSQMSPVVMGAGALQISEVTRGSPSVLSSRGQFKWCSNIILQERALLLCVELSVRFTDCALSLPAGSFAANNIGSSVNNEMFPATTKMDRRRRKLYKIWTSSPLLDSPQAVRKFNMSTDAMCWHLSCQIFYFIFFSVTCRSWGGERKWSCYH